MAYMTIVTSHTGAHVASANPCQQRGKCVLQADSPGGKQIDGLGW